MYSLDGVSVAFGDLLALSNVTLLSSPGITIVLGENGAGKTTLLRVLAGHQSPTSGDVRLGAARLPRGVAPGYLPQQTPTVAGLSAADYLRYFWYLKGLPGRPSSGVITDALAAVGLGDEASKSVTTLSGGMQRRLGLAVATLGRPPFLLLDEPTAGLDPRQRVAIRELVRGVAGEVPTLVSTHLAEDVAALADRVLVLQAGRVVYDGPLTDFAPAGPDGLVSAHAVEQAFERVLGAA